MRMRGNQRLIVKLLWLVLGSTMVGSILVVGALVYFAHDLPSPERIVRREGFATRIYDRNGKLLYDLFTDQRRVPVDISQVPLTLQQATIAVEDKNFYKNTYGVDFLTPLRIVWNVITKHRVIGGSTLTQQLVKNVLLTSERTITRKIREFILAIQIEQKYQKEQILQMYLNEAPYGGTAWGVQAASEIYFNKPVKDVTLAEAVILAGLPQSPTYYSPLTGKVYIDRAKEVLRRMREDGYITGDLEAKAKNDVEKIVISTASGTLKAPHFVFYVRDRLIEKYGEKAVEQGGLRVTTTLDLDLQETAQKAVSEEVDKIKNLRIGNGAAVAMDPITGQILAMVGSKGWGLPDFDGKFNVATQGPRQPGSSIKPIVYLAGLRKGFTAATLFMDTPTSFPGGDKPEYKPVNYDGKFRGPILMREALGNSINIPAVKMLAQIGIQDTLQLAYDMGLVTLKPTTEMLKRVGLSVALGGGEIHLLDEVSAYSAFANGGMRVDPVAVLKVTDADGKILEQWQPTENRRVISPEEAFIISAILADPKAREITFGPRSAINIVGRTVAVKTGTTNDKRDNWTVGWTPQIITGVWVGNNDNSPMRDVASGVTGAAPIWRRIMLTFLANKPDQSFVPPSNILTTDVDKISGFRAHDGFDSKSEFFIKGTESIGEDPIHKKIKICKGQDKLATPADIVNGNYDEKEYLFFKEEDPFSVNGSNKWQEGVLEWLKDQADNKYHPPTEMCGSDNQIAINVQEPSDHGQFGNDIKIRADIGASNKIAKVEFYLDNNLKQTLNNAPWEVTVNISGDGNHSIEVRAEDEKGNHGSKSVDIGVNQPWAMPTSTPTPTISP